MSGPRNKTGNSHPVVAVGDTVVLNDDGLKAVFGSAHGLRHMKSRQMKITFVDPESLTEPEASHQVRVDDPEIDEALLFHWMFDLMVPA